MAQVTVSPEAFSLVHFDAAAIAAGVAHVADRLGVPADQPIQVEVDEAAILTKAEVRATEPIGLWIQGGALEDPKRPRRLAEERVADALGLLLVEALDRRSPDFGAPPLDEQLDLPVLVAWQVHAAGRLAALGLIPAGPQQDRRRYHFRNRHGFTDAADQAFDRLWSPEPLTFAEIVGLSERARAVQPV